MKYTIDRQEKYNVLKVENEKLTKELDSQKDPQTTITMHLVKNNDFIQDVQNKLEISLNKVDSKKELR